MPKDLFITKVLHVKKCFSNNCRKKGFQHWTLTQCQQQFSACIIDYIAVIAWPPGNLSLPTVELLVSKELRHQYVGVC